MKTLALVTDTLRELSGKAMLIILIAISTLFLLGSLLAFSARETPEGVVLSFFGREAGAPVPADQVALFVKGVQSGLVSGLMTGIVLFGVFATAGVIPALLEKGVADLYLSKPISRWELLAGKYLGAVSAVFICALYFVGALFLVFGLRAGVWNLDLLIAVFGVLLVFAAIHTVVLFMGVVSGSTALSILAAYFYLFVLANILHGRQATLYIFSSNEIYRGAVDGLYYIFPQIPAMRDEIVKFVGSGEARWEPFLQSAASGLAILAGAGAVFRKKDF